ncbi:MAG: hypothetical protein ACM35H_03155 [Bacteroidota bacterium]
MPTIFRSAVLAALVACAALASPANAAGLVNYIQNESLELPQNIFSNPPALVFELKDGKYEAKKDESYSIPLRLKAEKKWNARITMWFLEEQGAKVTLASNGFSPTSLKKLDKSVTYKVGWNELKRFEAKGRKVCEQHGNPNEKVVKLDPNVRFSFKAIVWAETKNAWDPRVLYQALGIRIVCMPEPFEVKDVQLSVKYEGNSRDCPVNATLQAKFKTNKPEKKQFTFVLVRDNGMKQEVTKYAYPDGSGGVATWQKKYTFTKTESRKYMIYVKGHKATAMWVPVGANCSSGPGGGFSNGPIPTN